MKTDNIQALKDVLAGFSKAETEFDNYINTTRATDPDAEEMTIQLMGLIITFGEILAETVEYVIADETSCVSLLPKSVHCCYQNLSTPDYRNLCTSRYRLQEDLPAPVSRLYILHIDSSSPSACLPKFSSP